MIIISAKGKTIYCSLTESLIRLYTKMYQGFHSLTNTSGKLSISPPMRCWKFAQEIYKFLYLCICPNILVVTNGLTVGPFHFSSKISSRSLRLPPKLFFFYSHHVSCSRHFKWKFEENSIRSSSEIIFVLVEFYVYYVCVCLFCSALPGKGRTAGVRRIF